MKRKQNRWLAAALALCLLLGLCPFDLTARAAETTSTASGSATIADAQTVPVGEQVTTTLNEGDNYYAIPNVKAGQQVYVSLDKRYTGVAVWMCSVNGIPAKYYGGNEGAIVAEENGTYYLCLRVSNVQTPVEVAFSVALYDNDANEPNDSIQTATSITSGQSVDFTLLYNDVDYFAITTTKQSQLIRVSTQTEANSQIYSRLYDSAGGQALDGSGFWANGTQTYVFQTGAIGTYYLAFNSNDLKPTSASFTVELLDNDANEPNDTKASATELRDGESKEFTVVGHDYDYFKITTTKPGQDIALKVSGYDYTNKDQKIQLVFAPGSVVTDRTACGGYATLSGNSTLYFHAAEAGEHYVALYSNTNAICTRTLTAQILDGDCNEPNETKATATRLTVGTDQDFTVGGFGDEDWFAFEAVPGEGGKKLYTLRFTGLNTDYSDSFYYDLYAPDGTAIVKQAKVNIQHVYGFSCDQQGQYYVRVYTVAANSKDYFLGTWVSGKTETMDYPRSTLRICVSEGGDDPYESNDTWQTAASIPVGDIQHVLASAADADWFCFTVPENDMTLHLTGSKQTMATLYKAETLLENGEENSYSEFYNAYNNYRTIKYFGGTAGDLYWKLTDNGVYYLKLTAESSYVSADLRTTGLKLLPATDEENNDTWKNATPLYEGVPQNFTIGALNDIDWFKIVVPKDGTRLRFSKSSDTGLNYWLYREKDFEEAGDSAGYIKRWSAKDRILESLDAGTYYLKADNQIGAPYKETITYRIWPIEQNTSLATAKSIKVGEWTTYYNNSYFCIGLLRAGEVVRVSCDRTSVSNQYSNGVTLINAAGESVGYQEFSNCAFTIPEDGVYYLYAVAFDSYDDNNDRILNRIRYDVGSSEKEDLAIICEDSLTMIEGESMFLDLRCAPYDAMSSGSGYLFNVNTPSCVSYDNSTGYLTAKNVGSGTLTVSLNDDSSVEWEISVTVLAKDSLSATNVTIANAPDTLPLGASAELMADCTLTGGTALTNPQSAVTWTSSDPKVLYVAPGGKVTAVGSGSATVRAAVGNASDEITITVTVAEEPKDTVTSITLNKYSLTLYVGETGEQLTATILPEGSTASVVWQSSNPNVATVTEKGLVQAVAPGTSVITATAGGRHVSCIVSVLPARVRVTGVSFADSAYELPMGGTTPLSAMVSPSDATVKTLVWTSSDEGVATVSRTGIVTAVSVGETTIRATSTDGGYYAEVKVTVTAAARLGDVNQDGYIDSADAMLCLRAAVGLTELKDEQKKAADVNRDGFVDAGDAIKILRYDAKLIDSLN